MAVALTCLVVGVTDGDTIKVRCGDGEQEKVRLTQIDTPERKQAFGTQAKQALSDLVYKQQVKLIREDKDRYGRTLGAVHKDGVHINFELVRMGMAWCYRRYLKDPSCLDFEQSAREKKMGLWVDEKPIAPWEFRRR